MSSLTPQLVGSIAIICLGSLQFGYHMAELNSPEAVYSCKKSVPGNVPYDKSLFGSHGFTRCIPLEPQQVGLVTSIFCIGGLIGSFYVGSIADKIGRRKTAFLHSLLYFIGSSLNGLSINYYSLLVGRFIAGLGAGAALVITAVFINEIAPNEHKGLLGSMNQVSINIGILLTQVLSLSWTNDNQWRYLLLTGSLISIINFISVLLFLDESPLWLFNNGYSSQAFRALHKLRGGEYIQARNEVNSWSQEVGDESNQLLHNENEEEEEQAGTTSPPAVTLEMYLKSSEYYNSKLVATGILVLQQFCGINSIIFYGVSVLISIFPNHAIIINCLISLVNAVVTFGSSLFVDRLGRKPLLLTSVTFLGISTALMAIGIISKSSVLSVVATFTYITFFAIGLGPIPFLLVGEVTQPKAKASAQSWGTTMNWVATFIVGYLFPILKNSSIGGGVYFIFTFMCVVSYIFIKGCIPETKGTKSYEEVWNLRAD